MIELRSNGGASIASGARRTRAAGRGGFTLLEVMIVIVIILLIGGLVTVNLMGTKKSADTKLVKAQLMSLRDAIKHFVLEFNRVPTEEEGLAVLWNKDGLSEEDQAKWRKFLEEPLPRDPWGSEWEYRIVTADEATDEEEGYEIWSNGPDKEPETTDDVRPDRRTGDETGGGAEDVGPPPPSGPGR
jgi:general secretion pathway protein G